MAAVGSATFGGTAVDVPASALSGFDTQLGAELRRWTTAEPGFGPDGFTLAWLVTARIRMVGRSRLWAPLLSALAEIRDRHATHLRAADPFSAAYLDAILAGSSPGSTDPGDPGDQESYLALPLLRLVAADRCSNLDPDRLCALLLADLLWHERFADPVDHPDPAAHARRTERIADCIAQHDPGLGTAVPAPPGTAAGEWLALTALPMTTAHDEYLVIRVLQVYELVFARLTDLVARAADQRAGHPDPAAVLVRRAAYGFERATTLTALLAGARPDGLAATAGPDPAAPPGYRRFERAFRTLAAAAGVGLVDGPADGAVSGDGAGGAGPVDGVGGGNGIAVVGGAVSGDGAVSGNDSPAATAPRVIGPSDSGLAAAIASLEAAHRAWAATHGAVAARLWPTPPPTATGMIVPTPSVPPARGRPARPPLIDRAEHPARTRVGTPITLRVAARATGTGTGTTGPTGPTRASAGEVPATRRPDTR